jgi:hypothetical protein
MSSNIYWIYEIVVISGDRKYDFNGSMGFVASGSRSTPGYYR